MIESVTINRFKSIREATIPLRALNILIGSNGVGKSNFISFFELTKSIYEQRFGSYTMDHGGMDNLLYKGRKVSEQTEGLLDFDNRHAFKFVLRPKPSGTGYIAQAIDYHNSLGEEGKDYQNWKRYLQMLDLKSILTRKSLPGLPPLLNHVIIRKTLIPHLIRTIHAHKKNHSQL